MFYQNEKIETGIQGLDRLFYGGIQLHDMYPDSTESSSSNPSPQNLSLVIYGKSGTSRALLAMQLLHGLTKSLSCLAIKNIKNKENIITLGPPIFYSPNKNANNLSDMLLDTTISKCIHRIIKNNIEEDEKWDECKFSSAIFEVLPHDIIKNFNCSILDKYIGEEVVVYNNRTNALHLTVANRPNDDRNSSNDNSNLIAKRRHNDINKYQFSPDTIPKELAEEFFNISICGKESKDEFKSQLAEYSLNGKYIPCTVIDGALSYIGGYEKPDWLPYLERCSLITIFLIDDEKIIKEINPDLLIELRTYEDSEIHYSVNQLCIRKSMLQTIALGWHQYKKRDYGIEVYPSTHVLLQRRRHMPKALLRGYNDILSDTFQQYLNNAPKKEDIAFAYTNYTSSKEKTDSYRLQTIYNTLQNDLHTSNILKKILIDTTSDDEHESQITAIIGASNSYKRFLSLGRTFSASCAKQHTLYVLLDQEYHNMRRRIVCPTWELRAPFFNSKMKNIIDGKPFNRENGHVCRKCYSYIHFWDLRMGYITPDEFFYYFIQQLEIFKGPKRVIIDDIRKIEFSFPLLKADKQFLTTLISISKDYEVDLFILCDKSSSFVNELRALADNVICTEREANETRLYLEQYAGYNAPSHIFACRIKKMEELFYCESNEEDESNEESTRSYYLNENRVENLNIPNMDHYWMNNDIKNIVNVLKKKQ